MMRFHPRELETARRPAAAFDLLGFPQPTTTDTAAAGAGRKLPLIRSHGPASPLRLRGTARERVAQS